MPTDKAGPFAHYLAEVQVHLRGLTLEQRERVLNELQDHLQDAAHHAGADPHDPGFQREVMQRLGSSRKLGRALAQAYRIPRQRSHYLLNAMGGGAALASAGLLVLALPVGFLLQAYSLMIDMLTAAPVALIPTMVVLHTVYRPVQRGRSRLALLCGLAGMLPFFFVTVWHDLIELMGIHETVLHLPLDVLNASPVIGMTYVGLMGMWLISIGRLSTITGIPAQPQFAWMSMATGSAILAFVVGLGISNYLVPADSSLQRLTTAISDIAILAWFVCHVGWTVGTGLWLLQRRSYPLVQRT